MMKFMSINYKMYEFSRVCIVAEIVDDQASNHKESYGKVEYGQGWSAAERNDLADGNEKSAENLLRSEQSVDRIGQILIKRGQACVK